MAIPIRRHYYGYHIPIVPYKFGRKGSAVNKRTIALTQGPFSCILDISKYPTIRSIMLVELKTEGFSAVVPYLQTLPAMLVMSVSATNNPAIQMKKTMELLRDNIAPDLVDEFEQLNSIQMQDLLQQWLDNALV
jgi:hypothetical protein